MGGHGCKYCKISIGEEAVSKILTSMSVEFIREKTFIGCINIKQLYFDFFLPDHNCCIEFNGKQHYEPIIWFGGDKEYEKSKKRDKIKDEYCFNNNIRLLKITFDTKHDAMKSQICDFLN